MGDVPQRRAHVAEAFDAARRVVDHRLRTDATPTRKRADRFGQECVFVRLLDAGMGKTARLLVQPGGDRQVVAGGQHVRVLELPSTSAELACGLGEPQQDGDDQSIEAAQNEIVGTRFDPAGNELEALLDERALQAADPVRVWQAVRVGACDEARATADGAPKPGVRCNAGSFAWLEDQLDSEVWVAAGGTARPHRARTPAGG